MPDYHIIGKAHKGRHPTLAARQKMSLSQKGKPHNIKSRRKITCIDTGITYESIRCAARQIGVAPQSIHNSLKSMSRTSGGYHWKYV